MYISSRGKKAYQEKKRREALEDKCVTLASGTSFFCFGYEEARCAGARGVIGKVETVGYVTRTFQHCY